MIAADASNIGLAVFMIIFFGMVIVAILGGKP
jgi:hypothetical protein